MLLKSLPWNDLSSIPEDELLLEVQGCYVVLLEWGHVDWGESRSGTYLDQFLFPTHVEAKLAAEKYRSQGTYFSTTDVPSLCLRGVSGSYLVIDEPPEEPFVDFAGCSPAEDGGTVFPGAGLRGVIEDLVTDPPGLFGRFQRSGVIVARALDDRWFARLNGSHGRGYRSRPVGTEIPLAWDRGSSGYFEDGLETIVRAFETSSRSVPGYLELRAEALHMEARQPRVVTWEESVEIWDDRKELRGQMARLVR